MMRNLLTFLSDKLTELDCEVCCIRQYLIKPVGRRLMNGMVSMSNIKVDTDIAAGLLEEIELRELHMTRSTCHAEANWLEYQHLIFVTGWRLQYNSAQPALVFENTDEPGMLYTETLILNSIRNQAEALGAQVVNVVDGSAEANDLENLMTELVKSYTNFKRLKGTFSYHSRNRVIDRDGNKFIINPLLEIGKWLEEYKDGESS